MGILDNKKRFLDTIVTEEGRRQMASGKLRPCFVSFTDADAYYEYDASSGSTDASERMHFEAFSRPQDVITFESDDVGSILQFRGTRGGVLAGHVLVSSGSTYLSHPSSSIQRRDAQNELLSASFDNFIQQRLIGTFDNMRIDDAAPEFTLNQRMLTFETANIKKHVDVDDAPSVFQDRRFTHAINFKHLPPVMTVDGKIERFGRYARLDQGDTFTLAELKRHLRGKQHTVVRFTDTSDDNNVFGQFFELSNTVSKLDIVDFGEFSDADGTVHVFFAGKLIVDSHGTHTFLNIFTLLFS